MICLIEDGMNHFGEVLSKFFCVGVRPDHTVLENTRIFCKLIEIWMLDEKVVNLVWQKGLGLIGGFFSHQLL